MVKRALPEPFVQHFEDVISTDLKSNDVKLFRDFRRVSFDFDSWECQKTHYLKIRKRLTLDLSKENIYSLSSKWKVYSLFSFLISPSNKIVLDSFSFPFLQQAAEFLQKARDGESSKGHRHVEGQLAVFSNIGFENYFHLVTELIPRIELYENAYPNCRYLIPQLPEFGEELLRFIPIDEDRVIPQLPGFIYTADQLLATNWGLNFIPERFEWMCERLLTPSEENDKRLFVMRKDYLPRCLVNQDDVKNLFESYGFEAVRAEELSVSDQIDLFARANWVAGAHGSGLTNAIWMRSGNVIEIRPDGYDNRSLYHLGITSGVESYSVVSGAIVDKDLRMQAPIGRLNNLLNMVFPG